MRVEVEFHPGGNRRDVELATDATGLALVRALGLAPDGHVLVRGDAPIPEDETLRDGDRIRVLAVVSGG
ncbi:MAG: MoaD/ThiS family protein [Euryarchaeota archaeon]|nr:MoaD/ThiS family protein [Euryarchaeota archaeon]